MKCLIDRLEAERFLPREDMRRLLLTEDQETLQYLSQRALAARERVYGREVYIRGLIEISSFCRNDCLYCGLRRGNAHAARYRLTKDQILDRVRIGHELGFRTFVLQGGEDPWFTDDRVADIVRAIKLGAPDSAVTLSLGEREEESYRAWFEAGADRYLLRHETADETHYGRLHPPELSWRHRIDCLRSLKAIGYQTGCGFMVGSPFQTMDCLLDDLEFIHDFRPAMVGIGPFLPHKDTPFARETPGSADLTLRLLSILRLMKPDLLLPATTALATAESDGTIRGMLAGANVVMPNLSPPEVREKYMLYDHKRHTGDEAAESLASLRRHMAEIGFTVSVSRGDHKNTESISDEEDNLTQKKG